ncbi:MAG: amino acid ABC transporter ATP-binding protein [Proteobacteria bacterium]|nr:amino acid ABC transporter ATP-binding protein [Pseudomonadota bacterium]
MRKVCKTYQGPRGSQQTVLQDLDLDVKLGDRLCLIGPSGSGKSTCLRVINALETIQSGQIEVCGLDYQTSKLPIHRIRQYTAMVFQRFELFPHLNALENVALALRLVKAKARPEAEARAADLLNRVGLNDHKLKYPGQLSGGQQQRVSIARALATEPRVLLCDEPTSALDPELVHEVTDILQELAEQGMTMLIVTHEMNFARRVATQCLFLDQGQIVEQASPKAFFEDPQNTRLQKFLQLIRV